MVDNPTLRKAYKSIHRQYDRVQNQIKQLTCCDRLQKDYLNDYRKSLIDKLDGISIALDIIFKAIEQKEFY